MSGWDDGGGDWGAAAPGSNHGGGGHYVSVPEAPPSYQNEDAAFDRECNKVVEQMTKLSAFGKNIQAYTAHIGQREDTPSARAKLTKDIDEGTQTINRVRQMLQGDYRGFQSYLRGTASLVATRKKRLKKLLDQFTGITQSFQAAASAAMKGMQENVLHRSSTHSFSAMAEDPEAAMAFQELEAAISFDDRIAQEREQEIRHIHSQMQQINGIMRDLAVTVDEQDDSLAQMEFNIKEAHSRTEAGVENLVEADKAQKSGRSKLCILLWVIVLVAVGVTLFLIFRSKL